MNPCLQDKINAYQNHAKNCTACRSVDEKKPGARRCNRGFKIMLDTIEDPPRALAGN